MTSLLRSELLKQRTTRTTRTVLTAMVGLAVLVVCLHVFTLKAADLAEADNQPHVFGWGTTIGALFAALLGAISITGEFRHGTIRPTLLATPNRVRVIAAKVAAAGVAGIAVGVAAGAIVAGVGAAGFAIRGIPIALTAGDFAQMIAGGAAAAALWAVIGTGIGTLVRGQVGAVVGLCVWLLLIENILIGNLPGVAKYSPGSTAGALAGMTPDAGAAKLLVPALGAALLAGYAAVAAVTGLWSIDRTDID
jgi:ABC-type transport system involved in multi-copper enzyme maturation permease subunit